MKKKLITFAKKRKFLTTLIIISAAFVALFVLPFSSWLIAEEGMAATGDAEFCVSCHTMKPFEDAYKEDIHGGNSSHGVQATCTDCHLDHSNAGAYFFNKAQTGFHDMWVENFGDPESVDWIAGLEHRESYVYDSGCVSCHNNLEEATKASNKAFVAHRDYFAGSEQNQCVSCHEHVGHHNLSSYISNSGEE